MDFFPLFNYLPDCLAFILSAYWETSHVSCSREQHHQVHHCFFTRSVLAREENAMGKFLKQHGDEDATRAGSMMIAVGKSQAFTAQHR